MNSLRSMIDCSRPIVFGSSFQVARRALQERLAAVLVDGQSAALPATTSRFQRAVFSAPPFRSER